MAPHPAGRSLSRALYRALMFAYPRDFRRAHGEDAADVFVDVARAARRQGGVRLGKLWLRSIPAVLRGGLEERRAGRLFSHRSGPRAGPRWSADMLTSELRQSVRALIRRPGFTLTAVLTLALGIGATVAVFSVVDAVLLRPLPYDDAGQLIIVKHAAPEIASGEWGLSQAGYFYFRERSQALQDIGIYRSSALVLTGDGPPERLATARISAGVLSLLGVGPQLGRPFTASDDVPGAPPVAILSHGLWTRSFGGDESIVGRGVTLGGTRYEVIGVMPESFRFPSAGVAVWVTLGLDPAAPPVNSHIYDGIARVRADSSPEAAYTELTGLMGHFAEEMPAAYGGGFMEDSGFRVVVRTLLEDTVGDVRTVLFIVLAAAALVLIIACANVANLSMLRAEARRRELAVRGALGASRAAMLRCALAESGVVAAAAGVLGVALAWGGVRLLVLAAPAGLARVDEIGMRPAVVLAAVATVLAVALVLGIASVLHGGPGLADQLKSGGRAGSADRRRMRARSVFVVTQVAMAVLLMVGSGVLLRSFVKLRAVDPGFSPGNVLTLRLSVSPTRYQDNAAAMRFFHQVTEQVAELPGVAAAGIVEGLPLVSIANDNANGIADLPDGSEQTAVMDTKFAGAGYFEALGMRLVDGRFLERRDMDPATPGAVVSRAMAQEFWPGQSALGKRTRPLMTDYPWHTIVGVVDDVRGENLQQAQGPTVYFPYTDLPWNRSFDLAVRTEGRPAALLPAVRSLVWGLDEDVPISSVATMDELVAGHLSRASFTLTLVAAAAGMALFLCAVGIYGVIAYSVRQRHFEIGVRMALGAHAGQVAGMVIRQTMWLAGAGIFIGVGLALAVMGWLQSLLFEVTATDPATLVAVVVGLGLVAALAGALPARRATRVDALVALQGE